MAGQGFRQRHVGACVEPGRQLAALVFEVALHRVSATGSRILVTLRVVGEAVIQFGLTAVGEVGEPACDLHADFRREAGVVVVAVAPIRIGLYRRDLRALGADLIGGRAGPDRQHQGGAHLVGMADDPLQCPAPPIEPPTTAATLVMPNASSAAMSASTWSRTETSGNLEPHALPSGCGELGPVDPRKPPSTLVAIAHQRPVSIGAPGPATPSHQPSVSSPGPVGPVMCESPVSACSTTTTLSRLGESSPTVARRS